MEELPTACQTHTHRPWPQRIAACHQSPILWLCDGCHWELSHPHRLCHFSISVLSEAVRWRAWKEGQTHQLFHCGFGSILCAFGDVRIRSRPAERVLTHEREILFRICSTFAVCTPPFYELTGSLARLVIRHHQGLVLAFAAEFESLFQANFDALVNALLTDRSRPLGLLGNIY